MPDPTASTRIALPTKTLGEYLISLWVQYERWRSRRSARAFLHSLDDLTLSEFGLTRGDINAVLRNGA
jgi:uncharacterized protein YjiS (DUF1127 family)